ANKSSDFFDFFLPPRLFWLAQKKPLESKQLNRAPTLSAPFFRPSATFNNEDSSQPALALCGSFSLRSPHLQGRPQSLERLSQQEAVHSVAEAGAGHFFAGVAVEWETGISVCGVRTSLVR